jgi:hypothetical protein
VRVLVSTGAVLVPGVRAAAQTDLSIAKIEVTQGIQEGSGANLRTLVQGRETIARVYVDSTDADVAGVDAILLVEYPSGDSNSHAGSLNGPIVANGTTGSNDWAHTVNFCFVARETGTATITATVNPDGAVPETDDTNNELSVTVNFECVDRWSVGYVGVDYLDRGPPQDIEAGVGDAFILASFPVADFDYFRAGSTLTWDQNVDDDFVEAVFRAHLVTYRVTLDSPGEQLYAWVTGAIGHNGASTPIGNAGSPLAGQSALVAYGNTESDRYQRTFAHEMGHNLRGAGHDGLTLNWTGIDANNLLGLGHTRPKSLLQLMKGGQKTDKAWVKDGEWQTFYNHPQLTCGGLAPLGGGESPSTLVVGLYYEDTDTAEILEIFEFETGGIPLTEEVPTGLLRLEMRLSDDTLLGSLNFEPPVWPADSEEPPDENIRPFAVVMEPQGVKMELRKAASGDLLDSRIKSDDSPTGTFVGLTDGDTLTDGQVITWIGSDVNGGVLSYLLRWSADGTNWTPLTFIQNSNSAIFRGTELPGTLGATGALELLISDGFNTTTVDLVDLTFGDRKTPDVYIIAPRDGACVGEGANMHLRGSAHDAEDGRLTDSIVWTSSVDGALGTGMIVEVDALSAGAHEICAEATDGDAVTGMDCIALCVPERPPVPVDAALKLNEIYIAHLPPEDTEFIEVVGEPSTSLTSVFVLTVIGGGPNKGNLFSAQNLTPAGTMPADGYLVIGDATTPNVDLVFPGPSVLPNEALTFYLLEASNPMAIPPLIGTDLDTDDDGVLDGPIGTLGTVLDVVSVRDADPADFSYAMPVLGPSGALLPAGVYRPCDWTAPWSSTVFLNADPAATLGSPPTPGSRNTGCPPCPEDLDGDGTVGVVDFLAILAVWGPCAGCPEDLDGDGTVGVVDFLIILAAWGDCG